MVFLLVTKALIMLLFLDSSFFFVTEIGLRNGLLVLILSGDPILYPYAPPFVDNDLDPTESLSSSTGPWLRVATDGPGSDC